MNATAEDTNVQDSTLQVGQVLDGKYRVDYLVGRGGMAAVWAGTNLRTGKHVALKALLPSLAAIPGVDSLFQREALAASRIDHPNVVTVFDVIEHQGTACIVMELLTGESLDGYLARRGPLSVNDVYGLLLPAMRGVSAAHAQNVIHRDLKPPNIFVCIGPDGRAVTTKVLDFGISIIVERAREPALGQAPSSMMGTPAYMAPEQIAGGTSIDERADVYGFGVLFYEALTGHVPFPGEPGAALYESILRDPIPPLAQFRPDLPPGLIHIIETALAKDPAQRHVNLDFMVGALEDELLPATPMPRALTPSSGAGLAIASDVSTRRRITPIEAVLRKEPSGEHQAIRSLVNFPPEAESARRRTGTEAIEREASPPGGDSASATPPVGQWGWRWFVQPHRRQAMASVGFTGLVVGAALVLWSLSGNGVKPPHNLPPLVEGTRPPEIAPVAPLNDPVVTPVVPSPRMDSETPETPPPAVAATASEPQARPSVRARPGRGAIVSAAPLAAMNASLRQQPPRGGPGGAVSASPPSARRRSPANPAKLRAGSLSAEDF
jgi:serine/threonine-protein kinase